MNTLSMPIQYTTSLLKKIAFALFVIMINNQCYSQCKADFDWNIDSLAGKVQLLNTSNVPDTNVAITYSWYVPSNNVLSNIENPFISLPVGSDSVCLKIETVGCTDSVCYLVTIPPVFCSAQYSYTVNDSIGSVSFTNQSVGNSLLYLWSFGDAITSTDINPTHQYSSNGWYYVCLNISTSDSSCLNSQCTFVRINKSSPTPCVATFDYSYDANNSRLVHFLNTTNGNPDITSIWIFENDEISAVSNPSHLFDTTGLFKVCLLVSGTNCADSICQLIEIIDILPSCQAKFTYQLFPDSMNQTKRIAVFTNISEVDKPATYIWSFDDSTSSTEVSPIHYFNTNGLYKVCLTTQIGALCQDSSCTYLEIKPDTATTVIETNKVTILKKYPVPFDTELTIECFSPTSNTLTISIYNAVGQLLSVEAIKVIRGINKIIMNTHMLEKGLYLFQLQSANSIQLVKMIK
jgi:PKD repeat protein